MTAKLQTYTKYKNPGLEWVREIPAEWSIVPAKSLFSEISSKGNPNEQMLAATQEKGVVPVKK